MNMNFNYTGASAIAAAFAIVAGGVGIFTAIFWIVIGWRAMRAHERIAEVLRERLGAELPPPDQTAS